MLATRTVSQTDTTQAARYVSARILGDLLSIHEKLGMGTLSEMKELVHDVQIGLEYDCLTELLLILFRPTNSQPGRVYQYKRAAPGSFAPSPHSGRIERSREFEGGRIEYQVILRDWAMWERLQASGYLRIRWRLGVGRSIAGMTAKADGGYAKADLGVSRIVYER